MEDLEIKDLEIKTLEKENEKESQAADGKKILVMVLIIVGLFVFFIGGFSVYNKITGGTIINIDVLHQKNLEGKIGEEEGYVYKGYSFIKVDGLWWTETNKFGTRLKIPLHFGPKELEDINFEGKLDPNFNWGEDLYLSIDPNIANKYYSLALSELAFNMVKGMDRALIGSCTEENPVCDNRTIINCENANGRAVVVLLLEDTTPKIELKGTCLEVKGRGNYDIVKAANRLLYKWYGIMD